jgi:hypothetical protein
MSLFDGMTALFENIFDGVAMLHQEGGAEIPLRGIFREEPVEVPGVDGHTTMSVAPILKVRGEFARLLERGSRVSVEERPGEMFEVLVIYPTKSPAKDRHHLAVLTGVSP